MLYVKLNSVSHKFNSDVIFESRMTLLRCIFWVILIEYEFHINSEYFKFKWSKMTNVRPLTSINTRFLFRLSKIMFQHTQRSAPESKIDAS